MEGGERNIFIYLTGGIAGGCFQRRSTQTEGMYVEERRAEDAQ